MFFSIILPTYNRAALLKKAIDSVLNQTFSDWELIVVDDASHDNTENILKAYLNQDSRIHFIKKNKNSGPALTRNEGIILAQGQYITFLDSDDEYEKDHLLLHQKILLQDRELEMLYGSVEIIGDPYVKDYFDNTRFIHLKDCVLGATFFIRRDILLREGGFNNMSYGEDTELFHRLQSKNIKTQKLNFGTYKYNRTESDSITKKKEQE